MVERTVVDTGARASGLAAPLSIGLVSPGWPVEAFHNGIVSYVATLAPAFRAQGHRVSVLAQRLAGSPGDAVVYDGEEAWRRRSRARRLSDAAWFRLAGRAANRLIWKRLGESAARMVREQRVDVLEMEESFGAPRWVERACEVPVVVRLHGPWFLNGDALGVPKDAEYHGRVRAEGRALRSASAVTAPSRDVLERTRAFYGLALERAVVIPNPAPRSLDDRPWTLEGCDPTRVLFIGRFDRHKGGDLVVEAFGHVRRELPEARLSFVGPDRGFLDEHGRTWALPEFVRDRVPGALEATEVELLGERPFDALPELRRRAMITVISSRYETFGGTVTEAMSAGCPIVAARTGGIPEIVEDGRSGLLHAPGDARDLAAKLLTLLRDPALAARLGGQAARDCRARFDPAAVAAALAGFYADVVRTGAARRRP